jgi:hypothetical protein
MNIGIEDVDFLAAVALIVAKQIDPAAEKLFPEGFKCSITCTHGAVDMENLNRELNQRDAKLMDLGFAAGYEAAKVDLVAALQNVQRPGKIRTSE